MKKKISVLGTVCLLTTWLFTLPVVGAYEKGAVGYVAAVRGNVVAVNLKNESRILAVKSDVYEEDTIKTGEQGRIQIIFLDNSIISLGRSTEMRISQYQWQPEDNDGAMKTRVKEGVFRVMGGAITKIAPQKFCTETPSATIGIRGSMYAGRVQKDSLMVVFQGGKGIFISNSAGSVSISRPGFATYVEGLGLAPKKPFRLTTSEFKSFNEAFKSPNINESEAESEHEPENDAGHKTGGDTQPEQESAPGPSTSGESPVDPEGEAERRPEDEPHEEPQAAPSKHREGDPKSQSAFEENQRPGEEPDSLGETAYKWENDPESRSHPMAEEEGDKPPEEFFPQDWENAPDFMDPDEKETLLPDDPEDPFVNWKPFQENDPVDDDKKDDLQEEVLDVVSGKFFAMKKDKDGSMQGDHIWLGDTATPEQPFRVIDGVMTNQRVMEDGTRFSLAIPLPPFEKEADSSGTFVASGNLNVVSPQGVEQNFDLKTFFADGFHGFGVPPQPYDNAYYFGFLGFAGIPAPFLPYEGVSGYHGRAAGFLEEAQNLYGFSGDLEMEVNWRNRMLMGTLYKDETSSAGSNQLHFFGHIGGTGPDLDSVIFLGPEKGILGMPSIWEGHAAFGSFYGGEGQGFGAEAYGHTYDIMSSQSSPQGDWGLTMVGLRHVADPMDWMAPSGSSEFRGFILGVSENMRDPGAGRRIYMNQNPDDFHFYVDRDAGTLGGWVESARDIADPANEINHLMVGAENPSAYILDDRFAAVLGCPDGDDCIRHADTHQSGLKPEGNYLITAPPDEQFTDDCYARWGYWEIAFEDPDPNLSPEDRQYHVHVPGSLWVAGQQTPESYVQGLINSDFVGAYTGGARGVRIDPEAFMTELTSGRTHLIMNFSASAHEAVQGTIAFDQKTLSVDSFQSSINANGFSAAIDGAVGNGINGAFYGPNAESIGGNFSADFNGDRYLGVFGADRLQ